MGYRTLDKPVKPEDMLPRFEVRNGAIMRVAFGCFYLRRGHDPNYHDYKNWPAPNFHPGAICQMMPPRSEMRWRNDPVTGQPVGVDPIHLTDEGYDIVSIAFDDADIEQYLDYSAWIDEEDDNIVRIKVKTNLPLFEDKPKETRFTLFVSKPEEEAIDAVCHGIMTILPGSPYQQTS